MTTTEQDKELDRYAMSIVHMVGSIQHEKLPETITSSAFVDLRQASNDKAIDAIKQLITADRKRVALEARIDENEAWYALGRMIDPREFVAEVGRLELKKQEEV